eukprot:4654551-Amphidinium_carterae.1
MDEKCIGQRAGTGNYFLRFETFDLLREAFTIASSTLPPLFSVRTDLFAAALKLEANYRQ